MHQWLERGAARPLHAALVGVPFDGASTVRAGSRHAPDGGRSHVQELVGDHVALRSMRMIALRHVVADSRHTDSPLGAVRPLHLDPCRRFASDRVMHAVLKSVGVPAINPVIFVAVRRHGVNQTEDVVVVVALADAQHLHIAIQHLGGLRCICDTAWLIACP